MPFAGPMPQSLVRFLRRIGAVTGAAVSLALLLTTINLPSPLPLALAGLLLLTVVAAWRIDVALLVLAAAVPIARFAGRLLGTAAWPEMLALAVIAGWFCRRAITRDRLQGDLDAPLAVTAALIISSLLVVTTVTQWKLTGFLLPSTWLTTYAQGYFLMESSGDALDTAMRLLEMLVLLRAAASAAERQPQWAARLAAALVGGAAATAAINLGSLWTAAPEPGLSSVLRQFLSARVNVPYSDLNAAGSFFVMALAPAVGLALGHRRRGLATVAALFIAAGLWASGSRAAIIAGLLALVLPFAWRSRGWRTQTLRRSHVAIAALLVVAAVATAYLMPHRETQRSANDAARVRYELARSGLRMLATAPVFGVGIGNYFNLSGQFASNELLALFPPARRENAHNNYIQILAELGLAGFAACVWLAAVSARPVLRLLSEEAGQDEMRLRWGMAIGILAFAITCLGGHPLLIDEPAYSLALLCGAAAGLGTRGAAVTATSTTYRTQAARIAGVIVIALVAALPIRWYSARAALDLSEVAFGLTGWYAGRDGVAYRLAGTSSMVYVPSTYRAITIPLRATHPHGEVNLHIRVDGVTAEEMRIRADDWQLVRLALPRQRGASRFRRVDFEVTTRPQTPRVLFIGRITPITIEVRP
jgi:hypothetical protein